jgi:hypothetical protein
MKILRKFRYQYLNKSELFKYLIYAFGEIILVVIGILVAVYINNENEARKQENELKNVFKIIKSDLQNDIKEANYLLLIERNKKKFYDRFFDKELSIKDYKEQYKIRKLIFGYHEISFNYRGFKLLNEFKHIDNSKDSLFIKTIEIYTHRIDEVLADDELRDLEFKQNYNFWKKQDWWLAYVSDSKDKKDFSSEKYINYALNSQDYRNRVTSWHFVNTKAFIPEITRFIEEAEEVVFLIENKQLNE